ncbi:MAG TPA: tyrosine-type recombinase/integrase [Polyangiaceae bacterium]|nr:tyrosine-type recombinase/integrase [Polyangiaceae bacterium]
MSVAVQPWKRGGFQVTIRFRWPDRSIYRDRRVVDLPTLPQARKWGEQREREILAAGQLKPEEKKPKVQRKPIPALSAFWDRYMAHCTGDYEKASSIEAKRSIYKTHLGPRFGDLPLDEITSERISHLKADLAGKGRSRKTTNNVLTVLNACLKLAVKWGVIPGMPCSIEIAAVHDERPDFYDFPDFDRIVSAASKLGPNHLLLVLLGGEAGLRRGEMMALRQGDVDFNRNHLRVEQAAWKHSDKRAREQEIDDPIVIDKPKSNKGRIVPMTRRLHEALKAHRHLRGDFVLSDEAGETIPGHMLRDMLEAVQRRAGLPVMGSLHKLRHTFCSHLAMRGASPKAIQELAGHESLTTTLRYMHLAPSERDRAIALLDAPPGAPRANIGPMHSASSRNG